MMAEKIRFFVFTGSNTFVSDWQAVGNLLTYMQSTVTVFAGILEHKICSFRKVDSGFAISKITEYHRFGIVAKFFPIWYGATQMSLDQFQKAQKTTVKEYQNEQRN